MAGRESTDYDIESLGYLLCIYPRATRADFAPESSRSRRCEPHRFVKAGAERAAGVEEVPLAYGFDGGEYGTNFIAKAGVCGGGAEEVEEDGGKGCGCYVASCCLYK